MTVIDCFGEGRVRGRAHGEAARQVVRDALSRWEEATMAGASEPDILTYCEKFISTTGLIGAVERDMPDLAAELVGIAEASGVAYPLIAAYNLMDEQWWYDLGASAAEPGCSTLSVTNASGTLLAQNMDLPEFMDGSQLVLRIGDGKGSESLVLTSAGLIGLTGLNSRGFGICVNTLLMLRHNPNGIPVSFAMRHALSEDSAAAAVGALQSINHASGQHYAVGDRNGVTSLECSAGGAVISNDPSLRTMVHTNHPLVSQDIENWAMTLIEATDRIANSHERYDILKQAVADIKTADDIVSLLSDRSKCLCMTPEPPFSMQTFASMVFEIGETVSARFCLGQPGSRAWEKLTFSA